MDIFKEKFRLTQQIRLHLDPSTGPMFDDLVKEWALFVWEDALVFQLYPLLGEDDIITEADLADMGLFIDMLRGEDGTTPIEVSELADIDWQNDLVTDIELNKRLLRTIYVCLNKEDRVLAMALRTALDPLIINKNEIIPTEIKEIIIRPYTVLCTYFFFLLPDKLAYFIFESGLVLVGLKTGFDWEAIVRSATDRMTSFNHRQNLCIELAASLSENLTPLGQDIKGVHQDIKYWIDNFRIFSKNNFGGQELLMFLNSADYVGGCSGEDKELIRQVLELYTHLVNGFLAVPGGDLSAVENRMHALEKSGKSEDAFAYFDDKPGAYVGAVEEEVAPQSLPLAPANKSEFYLSNDDIRKIIISEFGYTPDGQYKNLEEIFARLQEFAIDFNRPEIADLYYFDEEKNKFVWKE